MLNLMLVLGQVPGTNFQLTFNEFMSALLVLVEVMVLFHYRARIWRFAHTLKLSILTPKGHQLKLQV
jgi:hypothetical protein